MNAAVELSSRTRYLARMRLIFFSFVFSLAACSASTEPSESPAELGSQGNESAEGGAEDSAASGDGAEAGASDEGCVKTGCGGQLCTEPGNEVMTTCEFRPEHACYREAVCERQEGGECGFTQTPELLDCLASPPPIQ